MNIPFDQSKKLQKRAQEVIPLGVNSNFRYWGEGITPYMAKAKDGSLWDVDGNKYIDYRLGFGPIILGHAYEAVNSKVREEIEYGTMAAMTTELEVEVAEKIVRMCPGVEMVRFACSGTEATMHAIRVARAYTGRETILKFEGNYHGFQDYTLWSTYAPAEAYGNPRNPIPIPSSSGIPRVLGEKVFTLPFNDMEGFERLMSSYGDQLAAVITEPCQGNCGAILPEQGFLETVQNKCEEFGAVFILDEVKTGFRIANGGAQEFYNLKPGLATYAKALGNGYPLAAFGGKAEIMGIIGHGVAQGGTYNNNKPGVAAAWATLTVLENEPVIKTLNERGKRLMDGISDIFTEAGILHCMNGYPAMFSYAVGVEKVASQRQWNESDKEYYLALVDALLERGVMPDHDPREPWFLCYAHSDKDIVDTLTAFREAVDAVKR